MATMHTTEDDLVNIIDHAVSLQLKERIIERLRIHAEEIIQDAAEQIVRDLEGRVEVYNRLDTNSLTVNLWVGPRGKENKKTFRTETV